jgi:hypothetical protein
LSPEDLFWRLFFIIGAMAHALAAGSLLRLISGGVCNPADMEDAMRRLVHFTSAGLRAPALRRSGRRTPDGAQGSD